jgi:hypothetical protein
MITKFHFFRVLILFNNEHVTSNLEQLNRYSVSDPTCFHASTHPGIKLADQILNTML